MESIDSLPNPSDAFMSSDDIGLMPFWDLFPDHEILDNLENDLIEHFLNFNNNLESPDTKSVNIFDDVAQDVVQTLQFEDQKSKIVF